MKSIIAEKSFKFAVRIVKFYRFLIKEKREYIIAKQIFRSGTSIGANVEEALGAISGKEFIAKLQIAYKEGRETRYWLKLLYESECISKQEFDSLFIDCQEIIRIIVSILKTTKVNLKNKKNNT